MAFYLAEHTEAPSERPSNSAARDLAASNPNNTPEAIAAFFGS